MNAEEMAAVIAALGLLQVILAGWQDRRRRKREEQRATDQERERRESIRRELLGLARTMDRALGGLLELQPLGIDRVAGHGDLWDPRAPGDLRRLGAEYSPDTSGPAADASALLGRVAGILGPYLQPKVYAKEGRQRLPVETVMPLIEQARQQLALLRGLVSEPARRA
jgi:hypothetical protein